MVVRLEVKHSLGLLANGLLLSLPQLDLATGMHGCSPAGDIMVSDTLVKAIWDERVVTKALSQMSPQTMSVHLASESGWQGGISRQGSPIDISGFTDWSAPSVTLDKKERVFGVNFATRPLGKLVEECRHAPALSSLKIPTSNPFVPARTRELTLLGPKVRSYPPLRRRPG